MGQRLRTEMDCLHPNYTTEAPTDSTSKFWSFNVGNMMYAYNYTRSALRVPVKVIDIRGPHSYRVELEDDQLWWRHINQL